MPATRHLHLCFDESPCAQPSWHRRKQLECRFHLPSNEKTVFPSEPFNYFIMRSNCWLTLSFVCQSRTSSMWLHLVAVALLCSLDGSHFFPPQRFKNCGNIFRISTRCTVSEGEITTLFALVAMRRTVCPPLLTARVVLIFRSLNTVQFREVREQGGRGVGIGKQEHQSVACVVLIVLG